MPSLPNAIPEKKFKKMKLFLQQIPSYKLEGKKENKNVNINYCIFSTAWTIFMKIEEPVGTHAKKFRHIDKL
jgi:hypothetical protein